MIVDYNKLWKLMIDKNINKKLKNKYHIPDEYDYIDKIRISNEKMKEIDNNIIKEYTL